MNLRAFPVFALLVSSSFIMAANQGHSHMAPGEKLGSVSFPVSCAAEVQKPFERGIALMHSFEYESAENQFKEVAKRDPQCGMAYWGQAMSLYHPLWSRPSKGDLKLGNDLLAKARELKPKTPRENEYVSALAVFYQDAEKSDHTKRADAYAKAMEKVYEDNPRDREAAVFYALSLLGSGSENDSTHANARKAVAILNRLFEQDPEHPGIAHYIIHACDNPQMANLGLAAARKYAGIAPSSPHAVHMPSHIFARLGLWQDDITSNRAAISAAEKMATMHLHVAHHRVHSLDFLEYAYLQIGDDATARQIIDELNHIRREDMTEGLEDYYDSMRILLPARYALERRQWKEALELQADPNTRPYVRALTFWAHAVAAGHLHDAAAAQSAVDQYNAMLEAVKKSDKPYQAGSMANTHDEAQAWLAFAQGKNEEAVRLLRAVADKQDKIGKGETETPAREMLADMLMEMNHPREALAEYEISLKTDPNRFNGLFGAAQTAEMTQQREKAAAYYGQLVKNCQESHSDRPELTKAKTLLAAR